MCRANMKHGKLLSLQHDSVSQWKAAVIPNGAGVEERDRKTERAESKGFHPPFVPLDCSQLHKTQTVLGRRRTHTSPPCQPSIVLDSSITR